MKNARSTFFKTDPRLRGDDMKKSGDDMKKSGDDMKQTADQPISIKRKGPEDIQLQCKKLLPPSLKRQKTKKSFQIFSKIKMKMRMKNHRLNQTSQPAFRESRHIFFQSPDTLTSSPEIQEIDLPRLASELAELTGGRVTVMIAKSPPEGYRLS